MKKIFKRSISILLAAVIVFSAVPLSGFVGLDLPEFSGFKRISDTVSDFFEGFAIKAAAVTYNGTCGENLTWELDTGTGELVISGEGYMYGWSWISGPTWSEYDDVIKKVVINEGVRNIGSFAFDSCTNMEEIYIPASAYIDSSVFGGCSSLKRIVVAEDNNRYSSDESGVLFNKAQTSIIMYPAGKEATYYTVPDNVKRIETDAFENCVNLTTVSFGVNSQLTYISLGAFSGCSRLEKIENFPDSLTYIGQSAFSDCTALTSVILPPYLTAIDDSTFYNCISLTEIEIPDSVSVIGEIAFAYCENLSKINIPEGVTSIGNRAFDCCYSLENIVIPQYVSIIGESTFNNCDSLTSIVIPEGVTTIGKSAFSSCSYLTAVSLPEKLTDIGEGAFKECYVLDDVYYAGAEEEWNKINIGENNEELTDSIFNYNFIYEEGVKLNGFKYSQAHTVNNYVNNNSNYKSTYFNGMAVPLDGSNGTPDMCIPGLSKEDDMVPQGITCYEDIKGRTWILISAYPSKGSTIKDRASVIYALDFNTGEYVAEFTIYNFDKTPHNDHVGGIAASEGCLYISNNSDSRINYISLDKLDVKEGTSKSIIIEGSYDFSSYLNGAKVSYLSYSDNYLWLGNFYHTTSQFNTPASKTHNSLVLGYKVTNFMGGDDNLKDENTDSKNELEDGVFKAKKPHFTFEIPDSVSKIQGVAVAFDYPHEVILMCSYGRGVASDVYSFRFKYDDFIGSDPNWVYTVDESSIKSFKGIPMLEGAVEYKDNIYMISESAAYYYNGYDSNNKSKDPTDVVWRISHDNYITSDSSDNDDHNNEQNEDNLGFTSINETVEYYSGKKKINIDVSLSAADFPNSSLSYSHNLASFCSQFAVVGYTKGKGGSELKSDKEQVLKSALDKIGFKSADTETNLDTAEDEVNYFVTSQKVNLAGETYNLVFAGFIGSNYGQWYTDFMPGTGVVHQGFMDARNFAYQELAWYISKKGFSKENTVILLTGHSRGAATANLVAAKLIDMEYFAYADNIYTYAFATPNSTTSKERTAQKYSRIFNIINPEDFVTKVMPSTWGYGRYGVTLVLPSKTNSYYYNSHYNKMNSYFKILTDGKDYQPFSNGENETYKVVKTFQNSVTSVEDFYSVNGRHVNLIPTSPYEYFQKVMCPLVGERNVEDQISALMMLAISAIPLTTSTPYDEFSRYFLTYAVIPKIGEMTGLPENVIDTLLSVAKGVADYGNSKFEPCFDDAHRADTYCAYMMTMSEDYLRENKSGYKNTVNCPVDIEVYDSATNELVGKITNNIIDETIAAKENSIVMDVNGDSKSFWLPSDGDYRVVLTGNDEGTMDYTVSEVDSNTGETQRINFFDVEIEDEVSMEGSITSEEFVLDEYVLTHEEIGTIEPTEKIGGDSAQNIIIKTSAEGNGYASGDITVTSGDYVTVTAASDNSGIFMGWYENGVLVSSDAELSFVAKVSRNLVAKFSEINLRTPSATTVRYGDTFILHADVTGELPEGSKIVWEASNENFEVVEVATDGSTCKITPKSSGDTTFTIKVVSANGEVIAEDTQVMTSKASLWDKIVAFFKKIFGLTKTIPQIYRGVF